MSASVGTPQSLFIARLLCGLSGLLVLPLLPCALLIVGLDFTIAREQVSMALTLLAVAGSLFLAAVTIPRLAPLLRLTWFEAPISYALWSATAAVVMTGVGSMGFAATVIVESLSPFLISLLVWAVGLTLIWPRQTALARWVAAQSTTLGDV